MPSRDGPNDDPIRRTILERRILRLRADQRASAEQLRSRSTAQAEPSDDRPARAMPAARRRGRFRARIARLAQLIVREGMWALAERQMSRASGRLAERTRIWRGAGRPWRTRWPAGFSPDQPSLRRRDGAACTRTGRCPAARTRPPPARPPESSRRPAVGRIRRQRALHLVPSIGERARVDRAIPDPAAAGPCARASSDGPTGSPDGLAGRARRALRLDGARLLHDLSPGQLDWGRRKVLRRAGRWVVQSMPGRAGRRPRPAGHGDDHRLARAIWPPSGRHRRVFAPSEDVRRRLGRYFDGLPIRVRPHAEALPSFDAWRRRRCSARRSGWPSWARSCR